MTEPASTPSGAPHGLDVRRAAVPGRIPDLVDGIRARHLQRRVHRMRGLDDAQARVEARRAERVRYAEAESAARDAARIGRDAVEAEYVARAAAVDAEMDAAVAAGDELRRQLALAVTADTTAVEARRKLALDHRADVEALRADQTAAAGSAKRAIATLTQRVLAAESFEQAQSLATLKTPLPDHLDERHRGWGRAVESSFWHRAQIRANMISLSLCGGGYVMGAVSMHSPAMTTGAALGVALNARSIYKARRGMAADEITAHAALFDPWVYDPYAAAPFAYTDPGNGWAALDKVRERFPEVGIELPAGDAEVAMRDDPDTPESVEFMTQQLFAARRIVAQHTRDAEFPAAVDFAVDRRGGVHIVLGLDPGIEERLDQFAAVFGIGVVEGSAYNMLLARADGGTVVSRYVFPADGSGSFEVKNLAWEEVRFQGAMLQLEAFGVTAPEPLAYLSPDDAWRAVEALAVYPEAGSYLFANADTIAQWRTEPDVALAHAKATFVLKACMTRLMEAPATFAVRLPQIAAILADGAIPGSVWPILDRVGDHIVVGRIIAGTPQTGRTGAVRFTPGGYVADWVDADGAHPWDLAENAVAIQAEASRGSELA